MPPIHNLNTKEIAKEFGVSVNTIRRLMKKRKIPHVFINSIPKFNLEECATYLAREGRVMTQ